MSTQPLVLVADDEPRITKLVSIALGEEGFRVVTANSGEEALQKAEEVRPDIILLDIVMPDLDGIEVMRQLRERRPVAVILLTAKGSTADKAKGLDLGADDYIAKPFHPDELAARVRAVLRRSSGAQPGAGILKFDDVEIDLERRLVTRDGEMVQLSRTEWLLLQHLASNAGKVVLHTELLTKVWGPEYRDDLQYLRVWVSRVRRKLGAEPGEPGRIKTFQGIGYLLDVEPPQAAESNADVESERDRGPVPHRVGRLRYPRGMQRYGPGTALVVVDVQNDFADPAGGLSVAGGDAIVPTVNGEIEMAVNNGATVVFTQDWHPAVHAALREGRRDLAGPLRRRHVGRARSTPTCIGPTMRPDRPQGRQRRGRLLRLHDARPHHRRDDPDRARGHPPRPSHRARGRASASRPTTASRRRRSTRPASASRRRVLTDAIAAVDLEPGDGDRAIETMREAGVALWRTVMR